MTSDDYPVPPRWWLNDHTHRGLINPERLMMRCKPSLRSYGLVYCEA